MAIIGLFGPHAIGKTTAANRWIARYHGLTAALADLQREATWQGRMLVRGWQGTAEQKFNLVRHHQQRGGVTIVESVWSTPARAFNPESPVIFVVCGWTTMLRLLQYRCESKGKQFRKDYWNQQRLDYESHRRYINFAARYLCPNQWKCFDINNQVEDWPTVDEYFGQLYRKLHNEGIRGCAK